VDLERREIIIIGGFLAFAFVWIFGVVPVLSSTPWFYDLNPIPAYFIYNLGFILLVAIVFGGLVSMLVFEESQVLGMVRVGLASWISFSWAFDMWMPGFYLSPSGQVVIPLGTAALENTTVDAMWATIWQGLLGNAVYVQVFGVSVWFILTYIVTPVMAIFLAALLLAPRKFVSLFHGGPM
jgi:hypothetical protein